MDITIAVPIDIWKLPLDRQIVEYAHLVLPALDAEAKEKKAPINDFLAALMGNIAFLLLQARKGQSPTLRHLNASDQHGVLMHLATEEKSFSPLRWKIMATLVVEPSLSGDRGYYYPQQEWHRMLMQSMNRPGFFLADIHTAFQKWAESRPEFNA